MRIAIGSDEETELTKALKILLQDLGHELFLFGALKNDNDETDWPLMASSVAKAVVSHEVDEGIICCWTGTGAAIAANKIKGIRAALVNDAETAKGARIWNHANVLALSLRSTSIPILKEILKAWFETSPQSLEAQTEWNLKQIKRIEELEEQ